MLHSLPQNLADTDGTVKDSEKPMGEASQPQRTLWSPEGRKCLHLLQRKTKSFNTLLQIHGFMLHNSLHKNLNLLTTFITTCASLAVSSSRPNNAVAIVQHARRFFDLIATHNRDPFLCNSMINTHFAIRQFVEPFTLYRDLCREKTAFTPDGYTFTLLAKGCSACMAAREGLELHGVVVKNGFCLDLYVATALVDMYVKFGVVGSARKVFDEMSTRSRVSWTAIIVGYARCGDMDEAGKLFDEMPDRDVAAFNVMIDGYVKLGCMGLAQNLFDKMRDKNVISWTSMVSGYCHNGDVESARLMFDLMPEKNLFTWNAMIGGYCQNKRPHEALKLFREMQSGATVEPNEVTVVSVLPAVADLGAVDLGGWIHRFAQRKRIDQSVRVCTALIDMYAKCGEITKAKLVFEEMAEKETASWNALINGLAVNGYAEEALEVFTAMIREGFKPNEITMLGVLSACNHCGLVEEGRKCFKAMEKFGIAPEIEHYGCMVDLLGRAGCLEEAENLIQTMPYDANGIILSSFLFACGYFNDVSRAERVLKEVVKIDEDCAGDYVMLRNLYATEKRWTDVEDVKQMMKKRGTNKEVACSVIEVDGSFREFAAGDYFHSHLEVIQLTLEQLCKQMKAEIIC
ncbi:pentatricopeptide repeat-containing protein At2g44880 [Abrus precatorius]|uniref:Pentatricopeptide repeat-containing protein At2g44880 n=1 Tax=Abrus precatorius TaxID=3816 RepID=A0A8B8L5C7_ABRPR|nr:pentatricopeptide repeat-containing protein At2g44880 [Abrus precatorius]